MINLNISSPNIFPKIPSLEIHHQNTIGMNGLIRVNWRRPPPHRCDNGKVGAHTCNYSPSNTGSSSAGIKINMCGQSPESCINRADPRRS